MIPTLDSIKRRGYKISLLAAEGYLPHAVGKKPYVILNAAMTLDGKIATASGDSKISSREDLARVHELRAEVDAIMVGINTVLKDDPKLTTKKPGGKNPIRIIVDSMARTPLNAQALTVDKATKTIIVVTKRAPKERVDFLKAAGGEIIYAGNGPGVDLVFLMDTLASRGVSSVMVEGGGSLNWSILHNGLADEVRVAIAPVIVGGRDAVTLVEGEGVSLIERGVHLSLEKTERYGRDIVLTYKVIGRIG